MIKIIIQTIKCFKKQKPPLILSSIYILLSICSTIQAQSNMYVRLTNGTQNTHTLLNIKSVTFTSQQMHVNFYNGNISSYNMPGIRYVSFTDYVSFLSPDFFSEDNSFLLFPNPASEYIYLTLPRSQSEKLQIKVYDIKGEYILGKEVYLSEPGSHKLDVSALSNGLYICKVEQGNLSISKKFIKN